ncbi:MAG: hypothetical protein IKA85_06355 [Clostridia bacterium]|nr:hypothetical protein [Clostridia bacterium]
MKIYLIICTVLSYLPTYILKELKSIGLENIDEVRLRDNLKVSVLVKGQKRTLGVSVKSSVDIEETVYNACKRSIYSYDEDIKNGFITTDKGERIGLAGEFVLKDNKVVTIKNFSSLVIRIPREVIGFSKRYFDNVFSNCSVLIFSKPGAGKTTFLRDLIKNISNLNTFNVVVIDERNEIASKTNKKGFDLGENVDVLTYSTKPYGFNQAIRTLNPDFIATDELSNDEDAFGVLRAILGGVKVIATTHASNIREIKENSFLKYLLKLKAFKNYIQIDNETGIRNITIFDENLSKICSF